MRINSHRGCTDSGTDRLTSDNYDTMTTSARIWMHLARAMLLARVTPLSAGGQPKPRADTQGSTGATTRKRVAVIFYGKHGVYEKRSSAMNANELADLRLVDAATGSWTAALFNGNPLCDFDVFVHSWSPEVKQITRDRFGARLKAAVHEPTAHPASFRCSTWQINCQRTMSQVLSMAKALQLKQQHTSSWLRSSTIWSLSAGTTLCFVTDGSGYCLTGT